MAKKKRHVPIRTCISCGSRKPKGELIRLVLDRDARITVDHSGTGEGRGAYVCNNPSCCNRLFRHKALGRFFKAARGVRIHPRFQCGEDFLRSQHHQARGRRA